MADLQDIYKTNETYKRHLKYIRNDWNISESDKKKILEFLRHTLIEGIGYVQGMKYIYGIKSFLSFYKEPLCNVKSENLKNWLGHMKEQYSNKTVQTRWYAVKKFFEHLGKKDLFLDLNPTFRQKGMKLPEELLTKKEIASMIENAYYLRDKAIISCLYESGCRIGEFLPRKIKHVVFDQYGAKLLVDGKTGMRRVRLVESVPLLANWIENHPQKNNPNAPLWTSLQNKVDEICYNAVTKVLRDTAERAGIKKKIHPHLFRHSRATELAKHLTEQQLKVYLGWTNSSDMAAIYVHLSGKDVDEAILKMNGEKPKEKEQVLQDNKTCPRCSQTMHYSSKFCSTCGAVLEIKDAISLI